MGSTAFPADAIRDDFIPKEDYLSSEFAELEAENLWPKVWQIACRLEEIPNKGDFVTYDIVDESIIVVRARDGEVKAFHTPVLTGAGTCDRQFPPRSATVP